MLRVVPLVAVLCLTAAAPSLAAAEGSLRGSPGSMVRQNEVARASDYSFLADAAAVRRMVENGYLVRVESGENHRLANVSFPYARPAVATFIERLAAQYREACGERLVVTSLTRPTSMQPSNAHRLSVHPAGMAVDLRISGNASCRNWLEGTLLSLERKGLLDATRENRPPHYHVAVFPEAYEAHVARLTANEGAAPEVAPRSPEPPGAAASAPAQEAAVAEEAAPRPPRDSAPWAVLAGLFLAGAGLVTSRERRRRGRWSPA